MRRVLLAMVVFLAGAACGEDVTGWYCLDDLSCIMGREGRPDARCFFDGVYGQFCANQDNSCGTGYRWDSHAGISSNECVKPAQIPDAAMTDGGVTGG